MKTIFHRGIALGALLALVVGGGCKVGTDYVAPQATVNEAYRIDEEKGVRQQVGADVASWWAQINDPTLARLTREAVENNLDLREALFRIQSARATLGVTRSYGLPQVTETGGYTHGRSSTTNKSYSAFDLATSASWEIDFFGRVARLVEAANADVEVLREAYRDSYVVLTADVAQAYIDARSCQEKIRISQENIEIQHSTVEITQTKSQVGSASKLDESQAIGLCRGTEANLLSVETELHHALNRMSILLGRTPGYVNDLMNEAAPIPNAPEEILVGIPADLLRRRPDVRAAEQQVIAQNARVGAAIGDLYPIFSLNGTFGLDSNSVSGMFNEDAIGASIGPSFRWNILNFGRYRFNVEAQQFKQQELIAAYQQAVLKAAKEVDDALGEYVNERDRVETLSQAVDAYTDAYNLSNERYKSGRIDFQRLLDSQTGKLAYELQYVECRASMMSSVVDLYRALGGDWAAGTSRVLNETVAQTPNAVASTPNAVVVATPNAPTVAADYDPSQEWRERQIASRERIGDGETQVAAESSDGAAFVGPQSPTTFVVDDAYASDDAYDESVDDGLTDAPLLTTGR